MVGVLATVLFWTSGIEDKVSRHPADCQHANDHEGIDDRGLLDHVSNEIRALGGGEDLVILARTSVVVM